MLSIVAVPLLVLLIPIFDAALVAISRLLSGRSAAAGHDHSSHRLVAIGLSERAAVGLLWLLAAVSSLIGVVAERSQQGLWGLVAAMFTIGIALFAVYLARVQVHEDVDPNRLPGKITSLGIELGYRRRFAEVLLDLLLVSVAYYGAYRVRFEGAQYAPNFVYFLESFPVVLGTQMIALFGVGAYRGMWRYFSLSDGVTFAKGVFLGVVTSQAVIVYLYGFEGYSPGVFVVHAMLLLLLLVGSRASFRLISEFAQRQRQLGRRLVIYGAGDAGSMAVWHVLNDSRSAYRIVGFIAQALAPDGARIKTVQSVLQPAASDQPVPDSGHHSPCLAGVSGRAWRRFAARGGAVSATPCEDVGGPRAADDAAVAVRPRATAVAQQSVPVAAGRLRTKRQFGNRVDPRGLGAADHCR